MKSAVNVGMAPVGAPANSSASAATPPSQTVNVRGPEVIDRAVTQAPHPVRHLPRAPVLTRGPVAGVPTPGRPAVTVPTRAVPVGAPIQVDPVAGVPTRAAPGGVPIRVDPVAGVPTRAAPGGVPMLAIQGDVPIRDPAVRAETGLTVIAGVPMPVDRVATARVHGRTEAVTPMHTGLVQTGPEPIVPAIRHVLLPDTIPVAGSMRSGVTISTATRTATARTGAGYGT